MIWHFCIETGRISPQPSLWLLAGAWSAGGSRRTRAAGPGWATGVKQCHLVRSQVLCGKERLSAERRATVIEVRRHFIRLGPLVGQVGQSADVAFIYRQDNTECEIMLV
jgi:hypothetical protein